MPERDTSVLLLPTNLPRARIAPQHLRTPTFLIIATPNIRQLSASCSLCRYVNLRDLRTSRGLIASFRCVYFLCRLESHRRPGMKPSFHSFRFLVLAGRANFSPSSAEKSADTNFARAFFLVFRFANRPLFSLFHPSQRQPVTNLPTAIG